MCAFLCRGHGTTRQRPTGSSTMGAADDHWDMNRNTARSSEPSEARMSDSSGGYALDRCVRACVRVCVCVHVCVCPFCFAIVCVCVCVYG